VSNAIIADEAIRAYRESKKKKGLAAPVGSAPHKYRMVCAPHRHPPQQHHYQLATCQPPHWNIVPRAMAPPPTVMHPPPQKMGLVPLHLLQLWSSWSHHSRLYCTNADFCSSSAEPLQPVTSGSNEGHRYQNWPGELHTYQGCPQGRARPRRHIFHEWAPSCHSV
jgi:hypothetical protein